MFAKRANKKLIITSGISKESLEESISPHWF